MYVSCNVTLLIHRSDNFVFVSSIFDTSSTEVGIIKLYILNSRHSVALKHIADDIICHEKIKTNSDPDPTNSNQSLILGN